MKITRALFLIPVAAMLNIGIANASDTVIVPATDALGNYLDLTGPISDTDVLSLTVSLTPYLQESDHYGVNAAGVVTAEGENGESVGSALYDINGREFYGALLISLSGVGGPVPVFSTTDPANGYGNPTNPPTVLEFGGTLSSLFGSFATVSNPRLTFTIYDTDYTNNSGDFKVVVSVPEPQTYVLAGAGFVFVVLATRRRRAAMGILAARP